LFSPLATWYLPLSSDIFDTNHQPLEHHGHRRPDLSLSPVYHSSFRFGPTGQGKEGRRVGRRA
jgi:hypothetical protein